jgi:hypothetical protein
MKLLAIEILKIRYFMFCLVWRPLIFRYQTSLFFQREKCFATDIKIRHLNNTHILFRNIAFSLRKLIIFKQYYAKFTISFPVYIRLRRISAECRRRRIMKQYDKCTFSILYIKSPRHLLFCALRLKVSSRYVKRQRSVQVTT